MIRPRHIAWAIWFVAVVLVALLFAQPAISLESPNRSNLVVPSGDCPNLPKVFRENRRFDKLFRQAAVKHFPAPLHRIGACWLKAQAAAESGLNPRATSPVGARGLAQFMAPTLADVSRQLGRTLHPYHARDSVEAQAVYVINLRKQLTSPRPSEQEAFKIVYGMYNAGGRNIWCAQRKAHGALLWRGIAPALHLCTGRHAEETRGYVRKISRFSGFPPDPAPANDNIPLPEFKPTVCLP